MNTYEKYFGDVEKASTTLGHNLEVCPRTLIDSDSFYGCDVMLECDECWKKALESEVEDERSERRENLFFGL